MGDGKKPVLVIGSLNMDLVARCEALPRRGQTIMGTGFFTAPGGKGANQAVAAARLGARVSMAGCIGRDAFGATLASALRDAGIRTGDVTEVDHPTGTALITVESAGANTIVVNSGANAACGAALAEQAISSADGPGILLLQNEIPPETNRHTISIARKQGWFVILNPAPARPIPPDLLPLIDLIAPNETEAAAILGHSISDRNGAVAAARALRARGTCAALITLGAEGAVYCDGAGAWHCPAMPVVAVDTTAAGDSYLGALAASLAEGQTVASSLAFAGAAAGLAVTRLGAQPSLPSREELAEFIRRNGLPAVKAV